MGHPTTDDFATDGAIDESPPRRRRWLVAALVALVALALVVTLLAVTRSPRAQVAQALANLSSGPTAAEFTVTEPFAAKGRLDVSGDEASIWSVGPAGEFGLVKGPDAVALRWAGSQWPNAAQFDALAASGLGDITYGLYGSWISFNTGPDSLLGARIAQLDAGRSRAGAAAADQLATAELAAVTENITVTRGSDLPGPAGSTQYDISVDTQAIGSQLRQAQLEGMRAALRLAQDRGKIDAATAQNALAAWEQLLEPDLGLDALQIHAWIRDGQFTKVTIAGDITAEITFGGQPQVAHAYDPVPGDKALVSLLQALLGKGSTTTQSA